MAWVTKEIVDSKRKAIKALNAKYGVKSSISGTSTSNLNLTIQKGSIDFLGDDFKYPEDYNRAGFDKFNNFQVNQFYLDRTFKGKALEYLQAANEILHEGHWDNSDSQSDYFSCAYYVRISVGKWDTPYILTF
jgi:hypothetical protein